MNTNVLSVVKRAAITVLISSVCMTATAAELVDYQVHGFEDAKVMGKLGRFMVPENRNVKGSKMIELKYVILPSTNPNPKAPIVYLAGGPGGSATATAKRSRFPLFLKLREVSDVVMFDQRGTGLSTTFKNCETESFDSTKPLDEKTFFAKSISGIKKCVAEWKEQDIDLDGYNTLESAHDLAALTRELGVKKVNLWGISYGTHLAFATAKYHPEIIDQMVLASSEGLNQTIKRPARVQGLIEKVAKMLTDNPETAKKYPNLIEIIRSVLNALEVKPQIVETVDFRTKKPITVGIGKMDVQFAISSIFLVDPQYLSKMPRMFKDMANGKFQEIGTYISYLKSAHAGFNPMSVAMDSASGITKERWQLVKQESKSALVGRTTNLPHPDINEYLPVKDLGDDFRKEVETDIPTLFLAGTLDGRTLHQTQLELAEGFSNKKVITIDGAGHNLFMSHPDVTTRMVAFFSKLAVSEETIKLAPLKFE